MSLAILALTKGGARLAGQLREKLQTEAGREAEIYVPARYAGEVTGEAMAFKGSLRTVFPGLFRRYRQIVCIMATGIVVRQLAGLVQDKMEDPAVAVVDENGQFAISLLGGHWAGANELCREIAGLLGGQAVITTSTDVQDIKAWDVLAREYGWHIANPDALVALNGALANGREVDLLVDTAGELPTPHELGLPATVVLRPWEEGEALAKAKAAAGAKAVAVLTPRVVQAGPGTLVMHPRTLHVGVGCRRGTAAAAIIEAVKEVLGEAGMAPEAIAGLASVDMKKDEAGLLQAAERLGADILFFTKDELNRAVAGEKLTVSSVAREKVGVDGVCEPAAFLAAGKGRLIIPKRLFPGITVALAGAVSPL